MQYFQIDKFGILFIIICFLSNCLRLYVDNDYNSALVINPTEQKIHTVSFSETILEKKQVIKDSELILYLSLHRLDYEIIKKGSNVRYAKKPIGYNYNFSSTTNTTCFEIQGKEGNLDDYWSKYPFHILLTLGIQIPFSILDYISLPIRMYPYYNYDRNSYEIKKLIKKTKLNPKNFAPFRILYYNEKGEKIYVGEFQNGRANLKRKNLFIPAYSDDVSISVIINVDNSYYPIKFSLFPKKEEIVLILE